MIDVKNEGEQEGVDGLTMRLTDIGGNVARKGCR